MSDDKPDNTEKDSIQTITVDANESKVEDLDKPEIQQHTEPDINMSDDTVAENAPEAHKPSKVCLPLNMLLSDDEFKKLVANIASEACKIKRQ